ncbi:hypothetical protein ACIQUQ_05140 [Streptomyces sp. NPDC101118]|uniref:hypothetical protein n=1 Tax=Streptomyces sp. NPDC101118 TaxID=3366109 RepID=UPI00380F117D
MQRIRTAALALAALLAAGAGIAYAQQGATGASAQRQLTTYVVWGRIDINPGQVGTARTDDCPAGQLVTGGGGFFSHPDPGAFTMNASSIAWNQGPKGWYVTGRNTAGSTGRLYTYGLCTDAVTALPPLSEAEGNVPPAPPGLVPGVPPGVADVPAGR